MKLFLHRVLVGCLLAVAYAAALVAFITVHLALMAAEQSRPLLWLTSGACAVIAAAAGVTAIRRS